MTYLTANLSLYQLRINLLVHSVTWCLSLLMHTCISHYWKTVNLQHPDTLENLVIVKKITLSPDNQKSMSVSTYFQREENRWHLPPTALQRDVISQRTKAMEYTSVCLKDSMFSRFILDSKTSGAIYLAVPTYRRRNWGDLTSWNCNSCFGFHCDLTSAFTETVPFDMYPKFQAILGTDHIFCCQGNLALSWLPTYLHLSWWGKNYSSF